MACEFLSNKNSEAFDGPEEIQIDLEASGASESALRCALSKVAPDLVSVPVKSFCGLQQND